MTEGPRRAVNDVVQDRVAEVPNPHTLLTNVPSTATWFTVIDLCSAFFSVPLAQQSQELFAFTFENQSYTYTRMPQGFKHSPHVFNQVLKDDLQGMDLQSVVLQYVDDLLLCAESREQCINDSLKLLEKLAKGGHKVSRKKLQFCQQEVEYLGRLISKEGKRMSNKQLDAIMKAPRPETVGQMMTFLGMTGFSMDWVEGYSDKTQPLRKLMKEAGLERLANKLCWNIDAELAFESIKKELMQAPALAVPDYDKPFDLYVATQTGYMKAVLMHHTQAGKRKQALAYYSMKLDEVASGFPPCYQDLAGVWEAYQKAVSITMGYPIKDIHSSQGR